jgi:penicillin V acylase-like amidase (Ntn superfamily)
MRRTSRSGIRVLLFACALLLAGASAQGCTRAVYFGQQGQTITGRSMDWVEDMQSNLYVFPRGMARDGGLGERSLRWTSRYGSVAVSAYEAGTADGMNEQGLVANLLYLAETEYTPPDDTRPALVISAWAQYLLDNFATVAEAVAEVRQEKFRMVGVDSPGGIQGKVHVSLSDAGGDSAIFEYIRGKLVIHHGRQYQVMTNSPTYDEQLALNEYWKQIGGTVMLPGTSRAADRFARASFYINAAAQTADARQAIAAVFSVIRNVSVPRGLSTPTQPNLSSTIWRTVADQKNKVYFFEDTASPGVVWVQLQGIDFGPASGVRKLTLHGNPGLGGDQTGNLRPAQPFRFLAPH